VSATPPGKKWILILGIAGFAAGFLGPIFFVPEANQGPLVGIFISGPAGFALGAMLWGLCALIKPAAQAQWRLLYSVATIGVVVTLLCVQPSPRMLGYVFDGEVQSCASPSAVEESVIAHWDQQVANYSYAEPRAGWQEDMRRQLGDAPGVIVTVRMQRQNAIRENRKPWNRGSQFASGWVQQSDDKFFYDADGSCAQYETGTTLRGFQRYDADQILSGPQVWPPSTLLRILSASAMAAVPARWAGI
jgi:hypothetical protein